MAGVVGLDHVQLAMPAGGEDRARTFYADLLGLTEVLKPEPLAARGGCWFAVPGSMNAVGQVHLGVEDSFAPARKAHPGLLVDDLDAVEAALGGAGYALNRVTDLPAVIRGHVFDPFGNRVELVQA